MSLTTLPTSKSRWKALQHFTPVLVSPFKASLHVIRLQGYQVRRRSLLEDGSIVQMDVLLGMN